MINYTRTRRANTSPPVLAYSNPSASITVWADGNTWRLVVDALGAPQGVFTFSARVPAEAAAKWLAYQDLTGVARDGMTWVQLVDAISDSRTAVVEPPKARPTHPEWMARSGDPRVSAVVARRRALEQADSADTPSSRVKAERRAAQEFHATISASAVREFVAKAPLTERMREDDGPELAEFFLRCLVADPALRSDTLEVLAELDG